MRLYGTLFNRCLTNATRAAVLLACIVYYSSALATEGCDSWPSWSKFVCTRLRDTWTKGDNELYMTGYAWHNRHYYDQARIHTYNELAWGGGLGKSYYDEDGDWHGLYGIAFLDSHKNVEPTFGYAFLKMLHLTDRARIGAGYTLLVTQRPDIFNGVPFPGALPWISLGYQRATLSATYIPGSHNVGNVLFILAKWVL